MENGTVIISGGAGFIGTRVAPRLLDSGRTVIVLDNLHRQVHPDGAWPEALDPRAIRIEGSVVELDDWLAAIDRSEGDISVLHLAAETGTGQSLTEARRHAGVNVLGTATMTDALVNRNVWPTSIVLTSSRAVYGEGEWLDEDGRPGAPDPRTAADLDQMRWMPRIGARFAVHPLPHVAKTVQPRPTNVYAATKLAQEHLLNSWCSAMGVPLSILRLQNVYGAGQALSNSYTGVLTFFATRSVAGEAIEVYEGGGILRDFVHVSDVATALVAALDAPGALREPVDIGSGEGVSLQRVAEIMADLSSAPAPIVTDRYRLGDVRAAFASIAAAQQALGYRPKVTLQDGLTELLSFARS
ncbi:NAD-dependent epimerase/dehydratase family protein [uncultured Amnibacterium sp.]|uniref:NAD-dependent epimerase/dehydratase family protein n=1 Tax=uncultured Amnibacterium sp. TaxID=1631851 RepID=UPI0035CAC373